jgi:hypothetical protein
MDSATTKLRQLFPEGSSVIVKKKSQTGTGTCLPAEVVGAVVEWKYSAAGAWFSKNGNPNISNADGKLQLLRLRLKKVDGEIADIIIDDLTSMSQLEAD